VRVASGHRLLVSTPSFFTGTGVRISPPFFSSQPVSTSATHFSSLSLPNRVVRIPSASPASSRFFSFPPATQASQNTPSCVSRVTRKHFSLSYPPEELFVFFCTSPSPSDSWLAGPLQRFPLSAGHPEDLVAFMSPEGRPWGSGKQAGPKTSRCFTYAPPFLRVAFFRIFFLPSIFRLAPPFCTPRLLRSIHLFPLFILPSPCVMPCFFFSSGYLFVPRSRPLPRSEKGFPPPCNRLREQWWRSSIITFQVSLDFLVAGGGLCLFSFSFLQLSLAGPSLLRLAPVSFYNGLFIFRSVCFPVVDRLPVRRLAPTSSILLIVALRSWACLGPPVTLPSRKF